MVVCEICRKSCFEMTSTKIKDGYICLDCDAKFKAIMGKHNPEQFDSAFYKELMLHPAEAEKIPRNIKASDDACCAEINFKNKRDERWIRWMEYGRRLGCHQMPERSVFIRGYQFPVCARCMGVIPASFAATLIFFWHKISIFSALMLCVIMFVDWLMQRLNIKSSTNARRFTKGKGR